MENHLILSGIYHPEHQKNNIENQAMGKMKKVNKNPNPSPENINIIISAVFFFFQSTVKPQLSGLAGT